ncbi:hypothetical protein DFH11DRAFT_1557125 [Phellopilus nigrolimitatus]|nr:hypothetical protein DFH11DRAFT_1557125 [Phellopilus nigrolimitatus]
MSYLHFKLLDDEQTQLLHDPGPPVATPDASLLMQQPPISTTHVQAPDSASSSSASYTVPPANAVFSAQRPAFQVQLPVAQLQQFQDRSPYGSGDSNDGYTLEFDSLESFQAWRASEEEENMVEFIKGDTHGSKAVPPRFKDHVKLVCARHCKSGRKKYKRKCPERNRKVPSRKIEGEGCPASISYKTYYRTTTVRAMYVKEHSHPIGPENLPFTRRGRKLAEQERKQQQQDGYCRANPVLNGTAVATAQLTMASEVAEAGESSSGKPSKDEPPVMARLEPPPPPHSGDIAVKDNMYQTSFVHGSSRPMHVNNHAQTSPAPMMTHYPSPADAYGNYRLMESFTASPQQFTAISTPSSSCSPQVPNAVVSPTQQTFLDSPVETHNRHLQQLEHIPSPTLPTSQTSMFSPITPPSSTSTHYLPPPPCSQPHFRQNVGFFFQPDPHVQLPRTQSFEAVQQSPLSPHSPSNVIMTLPSDQSQVYPHHYSLTQQPSIYQERWDRLELLFQTIRLHARANAFPMPSINALESILQRLYLEGPHSFSQSDQATGTADGGSAGPEFRKPIVARGHMRVLGMASGA